jgi:hypothetical protein
MKKRYNRKKTITCPRCASLKFETIIIIIIITDTKRRAYTSVQILYVQMYGDMEILKNQHVTNVAAMNSES